MNNILTVLRRELGNYFGSPIGYIFIIVFLVVNVGLFITPFFTFPVAEMRQFFGMLPIVLCVFIPAITMRSWAEEKKENTIELLLTFPMRTWELVAGKFLSGFLFLALALAGTGTIPVMLWSLGSPDPGPVLGGYLGSLLLGAFFLTLGFFVSSLCRDQIVAFVLTLLAVFGIFLLGTDFISTYLDGVLPGLGTLLMTLVGMAGHFESFGRGVVELSDLLYFLIWTAGFLFLNILSLEIRCRPAGRRYFAVTTVLVFGIGLVINWLVAERSLGRWDLTDGKIYTVTAATKNILGKLKVPIQVKVYITPRDKMPTEMKNIERDILDKLEELKLVSGGKIAYRAIHMEAANVLSDEPEEGEDGMPKAPKEEKDKENSIERRLLDKGVKPFSVQALREDAVTNQLVYSAVGIAYKEKEEEILPRLVPDNLFELEYQIVNAVAKVTREKAPVVALVAPRTPVKIDPRMEMFYRQMGQAPPQFDDPYQALEQVLRHEKFEVRRVKFVRDDPLPAEATAIAVINPRDLNARQRWELGRALAAGKSLILAVQNYQWDYRINRNRPVVNKTPETPGVNELLKQYGLEVSEEILMDVNHVPLTMADQSNPLAAMMGGFTVNYPIHILVNQETMNREVSITSRLSSLFYLWGSPLAVDAKKLKEFNLGYVELFSSSRDSWTRPASTPINEEAFRRPDSGCRPWPLACLVKGQFPDVTKGQARPEWPQEEPMPGAPPPPPPPAEEAAPGPVALAPGQLILAGCSQMFRREFLAQGNLDLFLNMAEAITAGDDLIKVRSKKPINRAIHKPSDASRSWWKFVNLGLVNLLLAGIGLIGAFLRKRSRENYALAQ